MQKTLQSKPGRVGVFLVVLLIGGVSVLILREPVAEAPVPALGDGPPDPVRFKNMDGHARMVAVLGEIAADPQNPYFGGVILPQLRAKLANVASGSREEANFRYELGGHELRLGNTKAAIEQLEKAYNIVANFKGEVPLRIRREVTYQLAMAYMRLGEDQNCVNCHTSESCLFPIQGSGVHAKKGGSSKAIRYLEEILEQDPQDASARWILNVAYMTLGKYPDGVPERHRIEPGTFDSEEEFPRFVDIAKRMALNTTSNSGGAIAEDFNNNDLLDIVVSNWAPDGQIRFFRNNGQGKFIDETEKAGLTGILGGLNLVQADYNNDGHTDVFVLRGAWLEGEAGRQPNSLLRNNGNGTFTDVTFDAGLAEDNHPTQTASWGDYDNDGQLDLFVGNEEGSSQLFHNNGNGTFTDLAARAGVTNNRFSKAVIWGDYNGDSHPDLYVSNLGQPNRLYRNNADGTFTDIADRLGVDLPRASFPAWFWDFDNDGNLDLFVSGYEIRDGVGNLAKSFLNMPHGAELARLYRGNGKGGFDEVSQQKNLKKLTMPMGANFGDLDNDGFLDFYLGTGYTDYEALMPNVMYHNRRGKSFADVTTAGGFGHLQKGHGVLFADLDNDGDQDVFEQIGGAFPGDVFGDVLFQNPGFGNHWIKLKLIGVQSNRSAIGARIKIQITEDGKQRSIYRHVNSGGSFGANSLRQDIGLGRATTIDTLEIHWPTSGLTQILYNIGVDSFLEITEKGKKVLKLPLPKIKF